MSRAKGFLALLFVGMVVALMFLPRGRTPSENVTVAESIRLYGYAADGAPLWEIRARDGRIDGPDQSLNGISIDFHGEDLAALRIHGDRLERSDAISRLSGDVRIERATDLLLETQTVVWDETEQLLESGSIDLFTEDLRMSAAEFGYDLESETASFAGGVEAVADLETEWTIRADRAEEHDGVVVFFDGVTAESKDGESFRCERLEVEPEVETVRLSGGVIGDWSSGHLTAESVQWDKEGTWATERVAARLDLQELRISDDT
jgi:hypothetical protein